MATLTKDALFLAPRQQLIDTIVEQQQQLQQLTSKLEQVEFTLQWFQRQIYGTKSERFIPDDEMQTMLQLGVEPPHNGQAAKKTQTISYQRDVSKSLKKETPATHGRGPMPTHLPIDEQVIEPEGDLSGMQRIGEEVSWHYDMEHTSLRVIKIIRPKYVRRHEDGVHIAQLPPLPIERGNAGAGLMAQVAIDKYVYHLPLERQCKKYHNEYKVDFSVSWLCDIITRTAFWITPIYEAYIQRLVSATYLQADETPIPVLMRSKKGSTHRGYFWVYNDPRAKTVVFVYRDSRESAGPLEFLKDFHGILQVDAYGGYDSVVRRPGISRAACMDHVRRRFEAALEYDGDRATHALDNMRTWYGVERQAKEDGVSLEERFARRVATTVGSMKTFGTWLAAQIPDVLPKSPMGYALSYAMNQWPHFQPFMTDPRVEISSISVENAIRPIALGRNNYLFCGSEEGARRAAKIYTLAAIAKLHGYDPFFHLKDLLTRLPSATNKQIDQFLLPNWKPTIAK